MTDMTATKNSPAALRHAVHTDGYAVLPGHLPAEWNARLIAGLDHLAETRPSEKRLMPHEPFLELLTTELMDGLVRPVLGEDYLFHHANGKRLTGGEGKVWHQDFDSDEPWDGRPETAMVHVMVYPDGLSESKGPLLLRPGTHRNRVPRHFPNSFEYERRADDLMVVGEPGLVAVVNSAMWHMRPPSAVAGTRYYLNFSFIGPAPLARPEREAYAQLLAGLPDLSNEPVRARELCRPHR